MSCYLCHCDVYVYVLSLCVLHANELYFLLISMPCYSDNKVLERLLAMCLGEIVMVFSSLPYSHPGCYITRAAIGMNLATDSGMCAITHMVWRIANQKLLSPWWPERCLWLKNIAYKNICYGNFVIWPCCELSLLSFKLSKLVMYFYLFES